MYEFILKSSWRLSSCRRHCWDVRLLVSVTLEKITSPFALHLISLLSIRSHLWFSLITAHLHRSHKTIHLIIFSIFQDSGQSARQGWPNAPGNNTFRITTTSALLIYLSLSAAYEGPFLFITIFHFCRGGGDFKAGRYLYMIVLDSHSWRQSSSPIPHLQTWLQ